MRQILAVFLFPKAFGLHLFFIGSDFGCDAGPLQRLTLFALVGAGTKDVDDFLLVRLLFLLYSAQSEEGRGRKESETAGATGAVFRREAVEFPLNDRAEESSGKMPVVFLKGTDLESSELHLVGDAVQRGGGTGNGGRDGDPRGNGA